MESLERYFVEESLLSDRPDDYLIIDSDLEIENPEAPLKHSNQKNLPLTDLDLNSHLTAQSFTKQSSTECNSELGSLSKFLKRQREGKSLVEMVREEINKVQSECEALEKLIQNAVKRQAELIVEKSKINRTKNTQAEKRRNDGPSQRQFSTSLAFHDQEMGGSSLDIKKTIKTGKGGKGNKQNRRII